MTELLFCSNLIGENSGFKGIFQHSIEDKMKIIKIISYGLIFGLALGGAVPAVQAGERKVQSKTSLKEKVKKVVRSRWFKLGVGMVLFVIVVRRIGPINAGLFVKEPLLEVTSKQELRDLLYPENPPECPLDHSGGFKLYWGPEIPRQDANTGCYRVVVSLKCDLDEVRYLREQGDQDGLPKHSRLSVCIDFDNLAAASEVNRRVLQHIKGKGVKSSVLGPQVSL